MTGNLDPMKSSPPPNEPWPGWFIFLADMVAGAALMRFL